MPTRPRSHPYIYSPLHPPRVSPPLFTTLATSSYPLRNESGPLGRPPPLSFSRVLRRVDRSLPVPLPYLNSIASLVARRMISSMVSSTAWMKQAEACGCSYWLAARSASCFVRFKNKFPCPHPLPTLYCWYRPTLNQTGLLNAPYWFTQSQVSSS